MTLSLSLFPAFVVALAVAYVALSCWGPRSVRDALARLTLCDLAAVLFGAFVIYWLIA